MPQTQSIQTQSMASFEQLQQRVQDLPPELRNCILEFVLWDDINTAVESGPSCIRVTRDYSKSQLSQEISELAPTDSLALRTTAAASDRPRIPTQVRRQILPFFVALLRDRRHGTLRRLAPELDSIPPVLDQNDPMRRGSGAGDGLLAFGDPDWRIDPQDLDRRFEEKQAGSSLLFVVVELPNQDWQGFRGVLDG